MFTAAVLFRGDRKAAAVLRTPSAPQRNLRARHVTVLTSILHISMLKRNYETAFHAYALLLRCKDADIKRVWDVGLEILRNIAPEKVVEFIQRLIAAYPTLSQAKQKNMTAEHFFPILIRQRISHGEFKEAFEELFDQLLVLPYSENPELHYYAGAIALHIALQPSTGDSERRDKLAYAKKAFDLMKAKGCGHWVPEDQLKEEE
ncbi:RNA polymerase I-specific transcription initiation factor rrn11 [Neolecta irregularis DAH-3]|uniref:RNA polymerase I-specific transcription initiation factor rrn11 n=1 Tax=Neolecta irregularis (strain DAH-3) TaxID=1198029 RepID=A0A1U7LVA6_NEOID|nr:RNA polymerase I-specific transcription initiation factor rrn11 [Neolecta irregularis DAH-3]|eukprot:OLL26559.1 RNA polymerase I-specific transcription initiation factor rrn11 [Neolecta irregularis DAH-3]